MKKSTIYIVVAVVVVIIIIAAAAAYVYYGQPGEGATPTPSPAPTVVGAATLQFTVDETTNGALVTYNYAMKGLMWSGNTPDTSKAVIRLDIPGGEAGNYSYIINPVEQKSWLSVDNGVTWSADDFAADWTAWSVYFNEYLTQLVNYDGHSETYSYTSASGSSIVISAIHINPTLDESLFAAS
jgi:hypothetical protein